MALVNVIYLRLLAGGGWCYAAGVPTCTGSIPAIGALATAIPLSWVRGLAVDAASNLYISDYKYNSLISYAGDCVFVVSTGGTFAAAFSGFADPIGLAFDGAGNLYVADTGTNRVCRVTAAGIVTTIAGSGVRRYSGDGGLAVQAQLNQPTGIAFDSGDNLYVADWGNQRIRKISAGSGVIGTVAGGGSATIPSADQSNIPSISSVVNGASFQPGIPSNSWITVLGTNLSSTTDTWTNAIVAGKLPTKLDGVSVDVSGQPAYIYFVSPNQINAVAPNLTPSFIRVTVSTPAGTSTGFSVSQALVSLGPFGSNVPWEALQPAFFLWPGGYAVATRQDFTWAVKNGAFPGAATVPAKPGEVVILWGTGFGLTNPTAPVGVQIPSGTMFITATPVSVTVGGKAAVVYGAALTPGNSGLYQVAIQVPPSLGNGDYPVIATIFGVQSPATTLLTVQQ